MTLHVLPFPAPDQASSFEHLCLALFKRLWNTDQAQLYGVSGQRQTGIDIVGRPDDGRDIYAVQCKVRSGPTGRLTLAEIAADIQKAEAHTPPITHLVFATTARRSAQLQSQVLTLTQERLDAGRFTISIMAWDDIQAELAIHQDIAQLHFPDFFVSAKQGAQAGIMAGASSGGSERSARLRVLLALLNDGKDSDKLAVSEIAEMLNLEKISSLESYFSGTDEPPLSLLKDTSDLFHVSLEWLLHGKGRPFSPPDAVFFDEAYEALDLIRRTSAEAIYFVRSSSEYGECIIILKYNEWKYLHLDTICHVSAHVGGTGSSQLLSLFNLIAELSKPEARLHCIGKTLDSDEFDKLLNGEVFAGSILEKPRTSCAWWDALLDIHYKRSTADKYQEWYGKSIVDAHRVIREQIEKEASWKVRHHFVKRL